MDRKDFTLLIIVILAYGAEAMTRQQLKNSSKMLRKSCLGKTGVDESKIANIEKGQFEEEKEVMCYIACIYQMTQVVKNGKLSYEASMKQVDLMYPQDMKDAVKVSIEHCKDVSTFRRTMKIACCVGRDDKRGGARGGDRGGGGVDDGEGEDGGVGGGIGGGGCGGIRAKKYKDLCEASYWTAKCMYEFDPKNFVFA